MSTSIILDVEAEEAAVRMTQTIPSELAYVRAPMDPGEEQRLRLMELSGAYSFWDRPEEDVYTLDDGFPA